MTGPHSMAMFMATVLKARAVVDPLRGQRVARQRLGHRHLEQADYPHEKGDGEDVPDLQQAGENQGQHQNAHGTHDELHGHEQTVAGQPVGDGPGEKGQEVQRHPRGGDGTHQEGGIGERQHEPAQHRPTPSGCPCPPGRWEHQTKAKLRWRKMPRGVDARFSGGRKSQWVLHGWTGWTGY